MILPKQRAARRPRGLRASKRPAVAGCGRLFASLLPAGLLALLRVETRWTGPDARLAFRPINEAVWAITYACMHLISHQPMVSDMVRPWP